jgi:benzoylformate decarboxylase
MPLMNGARAFLELLRGAGVRHVFGNPGSTEIPLLDALAEMDDLAYVLALHEAVALGMADGYAMASGRLGVFLGHVAPGLGNALGMLHDASKTRAPLLVAAGQQDGRFAFTEPFLWGELVDMARPLTKWAYQVDHAGDLPRAVRRAIKVATTPPTGPVFLALPADVLRAEGDFDVAPPVAVGARIRGDRDAIRDAARFLARAEEPLVVAGDEVGRSGAEAELLDLAAALGAPVYSEPASTTFNFPTQHPLYQGTLAREPKGVLGALEGVDLVCSVGAEVFSQASYAGVEPLPAGAALVQLNADAWQLGKNYRPAAAIWGDPKATLPELTAEVLALVDAAAAERARGRLERLTRRRAEALAAVDRQITAGAARRPMTGGALMRALVEHAPDGAVILDESSTSSLLLRPLLYPRRIPYFGFKSGGIGWGLPAAVGVAFARPGQVVLAVLGDGGALYTPQGLWTAAQHRAKVVFVICNNRQYRIVKHRLHGHGGAAARTGRFPGVELSDPPIDFAGLARSLGVHAARVEDPADVPGALRAAVARDGPALLEVVVEGSFPERER